MHRLPPDSTLHYYPWLQTLAHRLQAMKKKGNRVGYFYVSIDNSTFRYRVHNMVQALNEYSEDTSALWFTMEDCEFFDVIIDTIDVLVVCRAPYTATIEKLIARAKKLGRPVIFDTDDLIFSTAHVPLVMSSLDQDMGPTGAWDLWFAYVGRIAATLALCDRATTTNSYLAARLHESSGCDVDVLPNFLSADQIVASDKIYAEKAPEFQRDETLYIGYFSGSPTHNRDLAIAAPSLANLLDEDASIRIRLVGYMPSPGILARHADRIDVCQFQHFVRLQRLIGECEINIAPLQDNVFTNCKSELKFFEAAAVGTLTVASATHAFRTSIQDGVNGYLATPVSWSEKLAAAIAAVRDPQGRHQAMAEAGRRAAERYHPHAQIASIERALCGGVSRSSQFAADAAGAAGRIA